MQLWRKNIANVQPKVTALVLLKQPGPSLFFTKVSLAGLCFGSAFAAAGPTFCITAVAMAYQSFISDF
jgi:hypothetical protein